MRESSFNKLVDEKIFVIKESFIEITGDVNHGAVLSFLAYWHDLRKEIANKNKDLNQKLNRKGLPAKHSTSLLHFHTLEEIEKGILGICKRSTIKKVIATLAEKNLISVYKNPNPAYGFDRTNFYLVHEDEVNKQIYVKNMLRLKETFDSPDEDEMFTGDSSDGIDHTSDKSDLTSVKNDLTIPEIPAEIPTDINIETTSLLPEQSSSDTAEPETEDISIADKVDATEQVQESFERVWELYGRKGSKKKAFTKWKKINVYFHKMIEVHVTMYMKTRTVTDGFKKDFTTYLNEEYWRSQLVYGDKQDLILNFNENMDFDMKKSYKQQVLDYVDTIESGLRNESFIVMLENVFATKRVNAVLPVFIDKMKNHFCNAELGDKWKNLDYALIGMLEENLDLKEEISYNTLGYIGKEK